MPKQNEPLNSGLLNVPEFLSVNGVAEGPVGADARACVSYCERVQCQTFCQRMCQNCMGNPCQGSSQSCTTGCESVCQNCMGDACQSNCQTCQNGEGTCSTTCELACQSCQGVPCQVCQTVQGCQTACEKSSQTPSPPTSAGSITSISSDSNSITIQYSKIQLATSYKILYRKSSVTTASIDISNSHSAYTITGLEPDTDYVVNYHGSNAGGEGPNMPSGKSIRTKSGRPSFFSWKSGLVASRPAMNLLTSGEPFPRYLNATGWNLFTGNINDVRIFKRWGVYSFTQAVQGTTVLSAAMVNQAIDAIEAMRPSVSLPPVTTAQTTKISATLLNQLSDSINSLLA